MHCNYLSFLKKVLLVKVVNKEVKLLYFFFSGIFSDMATGRAVIEETWVEVLKNSDLDFLLKAVITLVPIDFSSLGNGL